VSSSEGKPTVSYQVGVAIIPVPAVAGALPESTLGYDEAAGMRGRHATDPRSRIAAVGEEAARIATEELAKQVAVTAQRFAAALDSDAVAHPGPGELGVESVEVTFGVTLTGGVQALFTAQAESSAQVTITLSRRPTT
jgi:hypothetical protein